MTHTVHPYSFRLNMLRDWRSRWFGVSKKYKDLLKADIIIREWLLKKMEKMYVEDIKIERLSSLAHIIITTSRPGLLIGRKGEGAENLKRALKEKIKKLRLVDSDIKITVEEIREPEIYASLTAKSVRDELEKRRPFRKTLKNALEKSIANKKVQGIKIALSGRLDGADMGRREWLQKGKIPLQTLRSDIEFSRERAHLPYGDIGIKVWIYKGEKFAEKS